MGVLKAFIEKMKEDGEKLGINTDCVELLESLGKLSLHSYPDFFDNMVSMTAAIAGAIKHYRMLKFIKEYHDDDIFDIIDYYGVERREWLNI